MNRHERAAILKPLIERLCTSHAWIKGPKGPRHVDTPFTAVSLSEHCAGSRTYGLCPIAPGESTTRVALLDFDSHDGTTSWEEMRAIVDRVVIALELDGYKPVLFRSSGGKGIHLFLTWDEPQEADAVRWMLFEVLNICGLKNGASGVVNGDVEVFPKQSEVAVGDCGSMFVLPLSPATKSELL